jgi:hypothetical protein
VRPYLETQAGIARLQTRVSGVGSGITFSGGAVVTDFGYRYRRIF